MFEDEGFHVFAVLPFEDSHWFVRMRRLCCRETLVYPPWFSSLRRLRCSRSALAEPNETSRKTSPSRTLGPFFARIRPLWSARALCPPLVLDSASSIFRSLDETSSFWKGQKRPSKPLNSTTGRLKNAVFGAFSCCARVVSPPSFSTPRRRFFARSTKQVVFGRVKNDPQNR